MRVEWVGEDYELVCNLQQKFDGCGERLYYKQEFDGCRRKLKVVGARIRGEPGGMGNKIQIWGVRKMG